MNFNRAINVIFILIMSSKEMPVFEGWLSNQRTCYPAFIYSAPTRSQSVRDMQLA